MGKTWTRRYMFTIWADPCGYHMGKSWAKFVKAQYGLARMGTMCDNPDFFFGGGDGQLVFQK